MLDPHLAVKVVVTLILVASIAAACLAPPPRRCPTKLAAALTATALASCVGGVLSGAVLLAAGVEASAAALWLLRALPDGDEDDGHVDPDAPDPHAFDWDEFHRTRPTTQSGAPVARR